ncbi:MAG: DoxX protein [Flavobacterium sp.]
MNSMFTKIVRIVLGLALVILGANMIKSFLPISPPEGLPSYFFPIVGFLEIIIGALLLSKKWVAFALILLAPISINIVLFHLFLDIPGAPFALLILVFNTILIFKHWQQYRPLFY